MIDKNKAEIILEDLVGNFGSVVNRLPEGVCLSISKRGCSYIFKISDLYGHVFIFEVERKNGRKNGKWQRKRKSAK